MSSGDGKIILYAPLNRIYITEIQIGVVIISSYYFILCFLLILFSILRIFFLEITLVRTPVLQNMCYCLLLNAMTEKIKNNVKIYLFNIN